MCVNSVSFANYTETENFTNTMMTPDQTLKEWKNACDSEMGTLERIKCWKVVDIYHTLEGTSGYKRVCKEKDF